MDNVLGYAYQVVSYEKVRVQASCFVERGNTQTTLNNMNTKRLFKGTSLPCDYVSISIMIRLIVSDCIRLFNDRLIRLIDSISCQLN